MDWRWTGLFRSRFFHSVKALRLYLFSLTLAGLSFLGVLDAHEFFDRIPGLILMLTLFVTVILTVETSFRVARAMAKEFQEGGIERDLHAFKTHGEMIDGLARASYASALWELTAYTFFAALLYGWLALVVPDICSWKFVLLYFPIYYSVSTRVIVSAAYLFLGLGIREAAPVDRLTTYTVLMCYTALSLFLPVAPRWISEASTPTILGYLLLLTGHCFVWKPIGRRLALRALAGPCS